MMQGEKKNSFKGHTNIQKIQIFKKYIHEKVIFTRRLKKSTKHIPVIVLVMTKTFLGILYVSNDSNCILKRFILRC